MTKIGLFGQMYGWKPINKHKMIITSSKQKSLKILQKNLHQWRPTQWKTFFLLIIVSFLAFESLVFIWCPISINGVLREKVYSWPKFLYSIQKRTYVWPGVCYILSWVCGASEKRNCCYPSSPICWWRMRGKE